MKIDEVCSPLKRFIATVRLVMKSGSATARTEIKSDSATNAMIVLTRIYGLGNVINQENAVAAEMVTTRCKK